jgi:hypothetical protein
MLETIHEFAREKLQESGEAEEIGRAHAQYFLALAEEAAPELYGPDQVSWMDRLEAEHDNFRAALTWTLEEGDAESALRIGGGCGGSGPFVAISAKDGAGCLRGYRGLKESPSASGRGDCAPLETWR